MIAYVSIAAYFTVQVRRFTEQVRGGGRQRVVELRLQRRVLQQLEAFREGRKNFVNHGDVVGRRPNSRSLVVVQLGVHVNVGGLVVLQLMGER